MKIINQRELKKSRAAEYLQWVLAIIFNGVVAFVWCVFGAAAAGNSNHAARNFLILSAFAAGIPMVLSVFLLFKENLRYAVWTSFATMPMLVFSLLLFGGLLGT